MNKSNVRIVKRTCFNGQVQFVIQCRYWFMPWKWIDAWDNRIHPLSTKNTFDTFLEAHKYLCYFDGSKDVDIVVVHKGKTRQ